MSSGSSLARSILACILVAAGVLVSRPVHAQTDRTWNAAPVGQLGGTALNPLQQMTQLRAAADLVPLEGAIDADDYIVGPGDLFDISVGGPQPLLVTLPVSADGYLTLPQSGAVDVAGRPLREARQAARQALIAQNQNVQVEVTLSQPRQFYVHVSGAVPAPGRYVATPIARVATVLSMAYADTTRAPVSNDQFRPALRNVRVIHKDGSKETVDLLRYFSTGYTEHNPYLRDGDIVAVPSYDPSYDAVFISGNVAFPGTYDHRPDDTLVDLLALATGEEEQRLRRGVRVTRSKDNGSVEATIYAASEIDGSVRVPERAQVHVLLEETLRGSAAIEGWVRFPGKYSIIPGETTLQDLLEFAGGLRPGALERGTYLQRATLPMPEPYVQMQHRFEVTPPSFHLMRADTLAIMQSTRLARMDYMSRAYLAHEMRIQNRVPIDLDDVLRGESPPIQLEDGDRVFVPRDENSVFVLGQVNRPGYVTYRPGMSFDEYVAASGGFSDNAGDAYVIKAGTGRYDRASVAEIESGDRVFVDRRVMRADTPELQRLLNEDRRASLEERSRLVQNIVQTVGAATAIVTTYLLIKRD